MAANNVLINDSEVFVLNDSFLLKLKRLAQKHPLKKSKVMLARKLN
jgi:hypothetical protein